MVTDFQNYEKLLNITSWKVRRTDYGSEEYFEKNKNDVVVKDFLIQRRRVIRNTLNTIKNY